MFLLFFATFVIFFGEDKKSFYKVSIFGQERHHQVPSGGGRHKGGGPRQLQPAQPLHGLTPGHRLWADHQGEHQKKHNYYYRKCPPRGKGE